MGGYPLNILYTNARYFSAQAAGVAAKELAATPSFGAYWESSLHRAMKITPGAFGVQLHRGDGRIVNFVYDTATSTYQQDIPSTQSLVYTGGQFVYSSAEGSETYDATGKLLTLKNTNGTTLTYSYSTAASAQAPAGGYLTQITDHNGRSLSFTYTLPAGGVAATDGLITQVSDSTGQSTRFAYDAQNNLKTITWPDTKQITFVYESPSLSWASTGVIDENGTRHITWGYDAAGRAISTELGGGVNKYTVSYATAPLLAATSAVDANGVNVTTHSWVAPAGVTLTLPNGQTTSLGATNVQGQNVLTSASQPAGSGCAAATSNQTVDSNGRLTRIDDFNGQRSCFVYDAKGQQTTRVEGLANTVDCASVLPTNASLPANARKTETSYHPDWSVPVQVKAPGTITTSIYQGQSDPLNNNQTASCTPASTLPNGKPLALVCKQVVQATLANGSIDTAVPSLASSYSYDAQGRVLTSTDPQGRVTSYTYAATTAFTGTAPTESGATVGDLQSITAPGGYVTTFNAYDRAGRILKSTDPKGVVTDISYTPRGWVSTVSTTAPGQSARTTSYAYDNAGQLTTVATPDGQSITYGYDAAHRLVLVRDAKGNRISYTLDNMGNRIKEDVQDPAGVLQRSISRSFDALNRLQQVSGAVQ